MCKRKSRIGAAAALAAGLLLSVAHQTGADSRMATDPSTRGAISPISLDHREGRVSLGALLSTLSLRTSLDVLGDRLDVVGPSGSCRLLLGSPLVLARGLFAVLSAPVTSSGGELLLPPDFVPKVLPALIGRSARLDPEKGQLVLGAQGSGSFDGLSVDQLPRYASFIGRDQYVPETIVREDQRGLKVVVLDPGHGGRSDGARGSTGTLEKELVLSVADKLKVLLEERLGVKVVLTRTADYYVGLKERTAIANNNRADLFVSIHANASFRKEIEGFETYYLSFAATDKAAGEFALEENRALGVTGSRGEGALLEAILWDMAQADFLSQSGQVAARIQKGMVGSLSGSDRGVRQAPLAVLMGARMPAVLVEIGFISNPEQEIRLNRSSHQDRIASALFEAIADYNRSLMFGGSGD